MHWSSKELLELNDILAGWSGFKAKSTPLQSKKTTVIEPDNNESESHDEGAYAAFEEAVKAQDHEAHTEAPQFGADLAHSSFLTFFLIFCQDLRFIVYF
jgi:hypothetical protein